MDSGNPFGGMILKWRQKQSATHIHTMEMMLDNNLRQCWENRPGDYIPIAMAGSHEEAHEMARTIAEKISHVWSKIHDKMEIALK